MNVDIGQIIAGKYQLTKLLGRGAMGEVWAATHRSLGGEFALKLVEPTDDFDVEAAQARFQLEAHVAAKLSRKTRHVVSVSDHGEENGLAYLVMELLEGQSLEQRIRTSTLTLPEVAAIVFQVTRAHTLIHAEGIVHRDLKPANVWLARDEDKRLLVKLLDFGIARTPQALRARSPFATSKEMVLGTPSYMSPEQARGLDSLDHRCDLWSLAVLAYESLALDIPWAGKTVEDIFLSICTFQMTPVRQKRPDLPVAVEEFFARAFHSELASRFGSAVELWEAFSLLVDPDELDRALGVQPSVRRISVPDKSPAVGPTGTPRMLPANAPPADAAPPEKASRPRMSSQVDSPGESMAVSSLPRRNASTWLIAIAGLITLFVAFGIVVMKVRSSDVPAAQGEVATAASVATPPPPVMTAPPPVAPSPIPEPSTVDSSRPLPKASTQLTTTPAKWKPAPPPTPTPATPPPVAKAAASVVAPSPPSPPSPPAPTPAAPAPAKTVNKGDVF